MCVCVCVFNREGTILNGGPLKLVDKFMYLSSSVSSTESEVNTSLMKVWIASDRLSIIQESDIYIHIYIYIHIGVCGVMVIIEGNAHE